MKKKLIKAILQSFFKMMHSLPNSILFKIPKGVMLFFYIVFLYLVETADKEYKQ